MKAPLNSLSEEARNRLVRQSHPDWMSPMLATLTEERFSDPGWIFEPKLDGERCLTFRKDSRLRLMSRNKLKLNDHYPELAEALLRQAAADFVVDGEIVAFEGARTSFARLQRRMQVANPERARRTGVAVYYYLFDLLHVAGYDMTKLPLRDRKALLRKMFRFTDPLRFTRHRNEKGEAYLEELCEKGWEGVIAKRADAPYTHKRSRDWLKFKCVNDQEFVIGGYTEPKGKRKGLGALLIGYYEGDRLVYAGKVGTGFSDETLDDLVRRLLPLERDEPPFAPDRLPHREVHWVAPKLVVQIGFTEWTADGQLRHPRYRGLRRDKRPRDVTRERPT
jgi:DNA ligase D-like protein (predicted ligase)